MLLVRVIGISFLLVVTSNSKPSGFSCDRAIRQLSFVDLFCASVNRLASGTAVEL